MQFKTIAAATLLAASVSAYEVLTPTLNSTVAKGETITIEWTSVDTDAEVFSVYLANFQTSHWPPTVLSLAQNVPRDDSSIDLRIPCDLSSDYGWQINFINGTNTYVIYAQSPVFELTGDCVEPTPEPTSSYPVVTGYPTATGYANTTAHGSTVTVKTTATATLCKTVSTVVYATPLVWFVEPSHEAVCDAPAKETVTVYADGPAPSCPSGGKPTTGAGGVPTTAPEGVPTSYPTGPSYNTTAVPPKPTGTGSAVPPEFTGAASTVRVSGAIAVIIGAVAFLL
jgi:hypothetical protein